MKQNAKIQSQTPVDMPLQTVGLDVGDRFTVVRVVNARGAIVERARVRSTPAAITTWFTGRAPCRVALETGTHSPWLSRLLATAGHEVIVGNARQLKLISGQHTKSDAVDAETLARVGRVDPQLLAPIRHRSAAAQRELAVVRARDSVVRLRTLLVNHVRGAVKAVGGRVPPCSTPSFARRAGAAIPPELSAAMAPLLNLLTTITETIRQYDRQVTQLATRQHPETARLTQVGGVGALTALAYVLTLEDPARFRRSRSVGSYLGLRPRQDDSGAHVSQLHITKAGDGLLRRLLVGSAQYILGPFGPDCDLQRWGHALAARGGKNAKKRAVVAVARKLAVLLHRLWRDGTPYDPFRARALVGPAPFANA